jgi:hypothetical protein
MSVAPLHAILRRAHHCVCCCFVLLVAYGKLQYVLYFIFASLHKGLPSIFIKTMPPASPPGVQNQAWFLGAPVSKLVAVGLVIAHVVIQSRNKGHYSPPSLDEDIKFYRLFTSKLVFGSTGETVLGTLALGMHMRRFEREMGSRKFLLLLLVTNVFTMILELTAMLSLDMLDLQYSGPYPILGAMILLYIKYTPRLHPRFVSVLGFAFSEKSLSYFLCAYVVGYQGIFTVVPTVLGMLAAYVFVHVHWDFPNFIVRAFKPLEGICALLVDPPPRVYAPLTQAQNARGAPRGNDPFAQQQPQRRAVRPPVAAAPPSPPPEEAIEQLTAMGFERQRVLDALQSTNNNVERAADRLLSGS